MSTRKPNPPIEVDLPEGEQIELFHLLVLIIRAKNFDLEDTHGAQSVIAKRVKSIHRKDGERMPLTAKDKRVLGKLAKDLPAVFPRASEHDKSKFEAEYASLVKRVNWLPIVASDDEAYRDRMDILGERVDERDALIRAINEKRYRSLMSRELKNTFILPSIVFHEAMPLPFFVRVACFNCTLFRPRMGEQLKSSYISKRH